MWRCDPVKNLVPLNITPSLELKTLKCLWSSYMKKASYLKKRKNGCSVKVLPVI